jgi:hypothetical protein
VQASELAGALADAARLLARAVASPAAGDQAARQLATDQGAEALAALSALAGTRLPARDGTDQMPVTEQVTGPSGPAPSASASPAAGVLTESWGQSPDRSTWIASAGETTLAVTRLIDGGWRPAVRRPGRPDTHGPRCRTRSNAQRWAEQHASGDETTGPQ